MSKLIKGVIGAVLTVVGVVVPGAQFLVGVGLSMVGSALRPSPRGGPRDASASQLQLGEYPRTAIFGRAATAGSLVDAFNYGGTYGTDWELQIVDLADHRCDALEGFYVNDTYVPFTGDGDVAGYNGQLKVYFRSGTETQTLPSIVTTSNPAAGWTANDNGAGVCYVVVAYKADAADAKNPVWSGGRPRFLWVVRGARCYDPRKDSTVAGGAGTHRWNNPATWEWSENPIVCRYNWVRGLYACDRVDQPDQLLIGRGLSAIEAPPEHVAWRANLCDEVVDGAPRYRVGGLVSAAEQFLAVEEAFAAACAGTIIQPEGAVEIDPGEARAPVAHFTDADLIVGSKVRWQDFLGSSDADWINTVVPSYVEPSQKWGPHAAPVRRNTPDLIADGGPRELTLSLGMVTNGAQAGRVGEIHRRLGRLTGRGQVTLPPRFAGIEEGDWVTWQSDRYFDGQTRTLRVDAWASDEGWKHQLVLRQISSTAYSDTAPLTDGSVATNQPPPPAIAAPAVGSWTAAAGHLAGGGIRVPALIITGASDNSVARFVRVESVQQVGVPDTATVWSDHGVAGPDVLRREIPAAAGATYYVGVSYVVDGIQGPRRVLGPIVAGDTSYPDGTPIEDLQPAEPGATDGAVVPQPGSGVAGNIRDHLGQIYDPGELLNTSIELTPAGRLQYRGLPEDPPVSLGDLALPDLGAASAEAMRRAEDDVDALATALSTALDEASQTRQTFTDAGFFVDPATGQVRIHAIEQTRERLSTAEVRLNAAEASISLRATVNYVDQAIASAVLDPSQVADLETIFVRLTAAEVDIDGLNATVTTLATATELSLVAGRVTTAEQAIDALEGQITTKVDTTTFNALETRVTSAESTLTAIGDVAQITNAVTATRLLAREVDANAEADLRALLQGDQAQRDQVAAIAAARQELRADVSDGLAAEATARLALQVRIGQAEASLATESIARATGDGALSAQITALQASTNSSVGALSASLTAEQQARTNADSALALSITSLNASFTTAITAEQEARVTAIADEAQARVAAVNAEADARIAAIAQEANDRGEAIIGEQQARIDAINDERAQTLADVAAEAAERQAAVTSLTASIEQEAIARADADGAIAASVTSLTTQVGEHTATLTQYGESIDGLEARQGVRLDVNGRVTGYVQNNDGTQGNFIIVADNFEVVDPDTGVAFLDADEDGLKLRNGRVIMDNGTFLKAIGTGFGTSGQFIEWFGPRPTGGDLALCEEATAISYLKTNGDAYFGGSLSAGTISNSGRSTLASATEFTLGTFSSNGGALTVVVNDVASRALASDSQTWRPGIDPAPADPFAASRVTYRATYLVESSIDGGANWTNRGNYTQDTISVSRVTGAGFTPPPDAEPLRRWQHVIEPSLTRTLTITLGAGSEHMIRFTRTSIIDLASGLSVAGQVATRTIGITSTEQ